MYSLTLEKKKRKKAKKSKTNFKYEDHLKLENRSHFLKILNALKSSEFKLPVFSHASSNKCVAKRR